MSKSRSSAVLISGVVFLLLGITWLLRRLDIDIQLPDWVLSWQMFLIVLGAILSTNSQKKSTGLIFMGLGTLFLALDLLQISYEFWRLLWPIMLIALGLSLLIKYFLPKSSVKTDSVAGPLNCTAILSGVKKAPTMDVFEGGDFTCIMGGVEVSLLATRLNNGTAVIEVYNLMGGIKIMIPASWSVRFETKNILGGAEEKRRNPGISADPNQVLVLKGLNLMGGIEVISY
jgi:predicted membrane protein